MSKFATGVAVVTTVDNASQGVGITVNSFNSVSLDPLLVLYILDKKATRYSKFIDQKYFTVNVLSQSQKEISQIFTVNQAVDWVKIGRKESLINSCPIINDVTAYFDCELYKVYDGGDHSIILGKVLDSRSFDVEPLIYHDRNYKAVSKI